MVFNLETGTPPLREYFLVQSHDRGEPCIRAPLLLDSKPFFDLLYSVFASVILYRSLREARCDLRCRTKNVNLNTLRTTCEFEFFGCVGGLEITFSLGLDNLHKGGYINTDVSPRCLKRDTKVRNATVTGTSAYHRRLSPNNCCPYMSLLRRNLKGAENSLTQRDDVEVPVAFRHVYGCMMIKFVPTFEKPCHNWACSAMLFVGSLCCNILLSCLIGPRCAHVAGPATSEQLTTRM